MAVTMVEKMVAMMVVWKVENLAVKMAVKLVEQRVVLMVVARAAWMAV